MPEHFRVAEVGSLEGDDGVAFILRERAATVVAVGDGLRLSLSGRGVHGDDGTLAEASCVVLVDHGRAAEDGTQRVGLDSRRLSLPVSEVARGGVSPRHVLPLRSVGIPLVVEVPHAVLIEHAVGVVHPAIRGCVMILWTELLAVGSVEGVALLHLLPAHVALHGTRSAAVAVERDVEEEGVGRGGFCVESSQVEGHIVVHLVDSQFGVERLHLLTIHDDADVGILLALLNGEQQVAALRGQAQHGVFLRQDLRSLGTNAEPAHEAHCQQE